ncbi:MAG: hypothetical protein GX963_03285 [Bacteroidales bacterium]|nr:hypothetical protein [Bacteroidales bacterium]
MKKEEDFLEDEFGTEAIIYIKQYLPQELKDKFSDDELYYFLDLIDEYYISSGILEKETDEEGFVEVDIEDITRFIIKEAKKDDMGNYDPDEIFLIVQAEMDMFDSYDE